MVSCRYSKAARKETSRTFEQIGGGALFASNCYLQFCNGIFLSSLIGLTVQRVTGEFFRLLPSIEGCRDRHESLERKVISTSTFYYF